MPKMHVFASKGVSKFLFLSGVYFPAFFGEILSQLFDILQKVRNSNLYRFRTTQQSKAKQSVAAFS
jgi:hypothetical protein